MPTDIEDKFIRYMREPAADCTLSRSSCSAHFERAARDLWLVYGPMLRPTPRGRDLLATADAINYDPDAKAEPVDKQPETVPCTDCKGRGRVPLSELQGTQDRNMKELVEGPDGRRSTQVEREEPVLLAGWDVTCTTCKGLKVVPAVHPPDFFIDYQPLPLRRQGPRTSYPSAESKSVPKPYSDHPIYALAVQLHASAKARTITDTKISIGPGGTNLRGGWIDFDSRDSLAGLLHKEVELRHSLETGAVCRGLLGWSIGTEGLITIGVDGYTFNSDNGYQIREVPEDYRARGFASVFNEPYNEPSLGYSDFTPLSVHLIDPRGTKFETTEASDGWISFDTYADVEGLEGKEVDVRRDGDLCSSGHIRKVGGNEHHSWIEFEITGRSFSGGTGWEIRPHCAGAL